MMAHLRDLRIVWSRHKGLKVIRIVRLVSECTVGAL